MARRRLLSILAASTLFTAAFAGPAAAIELVDATEAPVAEATEEPVEVVEEVVATVDAEPVDEVADVVEETVAPEPASPRSADPSPTKVQEPAPAPADTDGTDEELVAAGGVAAAPDLSFLARTGDRMPTPEPRFDLLLGAPAATPAAPATTTVEAPLVADAPAELAQGAGASAPSVLAQPASSAVPDEGTPVLVLVAFASLLAAGSATVREARLAATA